MVILLPAPPNMNYVPPEPKVHFVSEEAVSYQTQRLYDSLYLIEFDYVPHRDVTFKIASDKRILRVLGTKIKVIDQKKYTATVTLYDVKENSRELRVEVSVVD